MILELSPLQVIDLCRSVTHADTQIMLLKNTYVLNFSVKPIQRKLSLMSSEGRSTCVYVQSYRHSCYFFDREQKVNCCIVRPVKAKFKMWVYIVGKAA